MSIGLVLALLAVAIALFIVNALVSRRYTKVYEESHQKPITRKERTWYSGTDPDPIVERWRRYRIATNVGNLVGLVLIVFPWVVGIKR